MRKHYFNEDFFENIDTEEKAYWLGFISADGNVCKTSKVYNSWRISINLNQIDHNHLEKFKKSIESNDIEINDYIHKGSFSNINGSKMSKISVNSYKMCNDLIKLGVTPNKSYSIEMPNIREDLIRHYLRGYFDGDGCYYYKKYPNRVRYSFEVVGMSEIILSQFKNILSLVDIKLNIYKRDRNNSIRLMTSSKNEIIKLIHYLYDDCNIYLDRKYEKINDILNIAV